MIDEIANKSTESPIIGTILKIYHQFKKLPKLNKLNLFY